MNVHFAYTIAIPIFGFLAVLAWRIRETQTPVTARKIIAPPMGMATGFCMFLVPVFRVPWSWALVSLVLGATLLAYPLSRTTTLWADLSTGRIMLKRSPAFFLVFIGLGLIRFWARAWIGQYISITQTGAVFYLLAFGMIVRWRYTMFQQFSRLSMVSPA